MHTNEAQDTDLHSSHPHRLGLPAQRCLFSQEASASGSFLSHRGLVTMSAPNFPVVGKAQSCEQLGTEPHADQAALGQRDHPCKGEILSLASIACAARVVQRQKIITCQSAGKKPKSFIQFITANPHPVTVQTGLSYHSAT